MKDYSEYYGAHSNTQHVMHHNDNTPRVSAKAEKNTKGYNWEASVTCAETVEEAMELLQKLTESLQRVYGNPQA
jgi:hypothetical protein